jgi:thiol-disulfide isomerase/thioredoxin
MELIQFSTSTCPPCRAAKEYIERNYDVDFINYKYISIETIGTQDPKYLALLEETNARRVPIFVVTEDGKMIYSFTGFGSSCKEEISKYVEYVTKNSKNKIQDNIPEELELKIIEMQKGFSKPSKNGHIDEEDFIEDYDELDDEDFDEDSDDDFIDD